VVGLQLKRHLLTEVIDWFASGRLAPGYGTLIQSSICSRSAQSAWSTCRLMLRIGRNLGSLRNTPTSFARNPRAYGSSGDLGDKAHARDRKQP
jgi:hypothetical protein